MLITEDMKGAWFQTASGRKFPIFTPELSDYYIEDISSSLANQCRFNGHTRRFYSVARHSLNVMKIVSPRAKAWALMHDAGEAYVSDIITPLKRHLPLAKETEQLIQTDLIIRFNIPYDDAIDEEVHAADRYMVFLEAEKLLRNPDLLKEWSLARIPFMPQAQPYLGPSLPIIDKLMFERAFRKHVVNAELWP